MSGGKLTERERELLEIVRVSVDEPNGFVPRVDCAHHRNQPLLYQMKAGGLIHFTALNPVISITPAGRSALTVGGGEEDGSALVESAVSHTDTPAQSPAGGEG